MTASPNSKTSASLPEPMRRPRAGEVPFPARFMNPILAAQDANIAWLLMRPRWLGNLRDSLADFLEIGRPRLGGDVAQGDDADQVLVPVEDREAPHLQGLHAGQHLLGALLFEGPGNVLG